MSSAAPIWGKSIATEDIGAVPFRMYTERPRRIEHLLALGERWGARPYIVQGERTVTFEDVLRASAAKSQELAACGVRRGERVFILGWNSPEWIVNFWACVRIAALPVLANAWWSEAELDYALNLLRPALTLADARGAARIDARWRRGSWKMPDCAPARSADVPAADRLAPDENEPAVVIFTSGTQGMAKAVVLAHRSLLAQLQMLLHITRRLPHQIDATTGEVSLHTGPLFHIGGVQALLRGITIGNTLVLPRGRFDAGEALELIERHKVRRWNAVPTMATRLLEHPDVPRRDLSSLEAMTVGGAAVHPQLLQRMRTGLPNVRPTVATGYGLSENAGQATAASGADTALRPGSCGRPLPCVELKILPRPGFPDGEVLVRSPTQMLGYFGEAQSPIDDEGWLHSGDLGRIDADGHLWITGRCKDLIIRGAENISPVAVEHALEAVPGVTEAVVFGVPHAELGEEVAAVVVVSTDLTSQQLETRLREKIASFAVPSRWRIQKEPLPVNQTGKVDKAALMSEARLGRVS
ncbi:MAG: acyl--CoA ligase [Burkholderiales bacterium]|nr:acyl--CoA ligase [Burkholderiales bacterium]